MPEIEFIAMADEHLAKEVLAMMHGLYSEDQPAATDQQRFPLTIEFLLKEPSRGRIILFTENAILCGYSLLIPYWSNEFGGTLLFVDELFVAPEARNRGIGHRFFEFLHRKRPFNAVAIALEVSPANIRARRLYESLGFRNRHSSMLTYCLPHHSGGDGDCRK